MVVKLKNITLEKMLPARYCFFGLSRRFYAANGSIRQAGGSIGKMGEANEEQYFRRLVSF